jgi:DNA-binding transcriptional LysR family regulator
MNTQQLESFIQVAENLNFARAAEALNITQSAVSRQIRSLEEELGTPLFHRSTRAVSLTPAGIIFLNDAKDILLKLQMSAQKLQNHSNTALQVLSIGCMNETYLSLLTPLLENCRNQFPEIHPFFRIVPSRAFLNLFFHGELDLLFGFQDDILIQDGFQYCELTRLPICYALHADHPLAKKERLTEQEILEIPLIICNSFELPAPAADLQTQLSHKISPDAANYCENLQIMLTLIRAGYGIGIIPEIPSLGDEIACIPIEQNLSLSYGFLYKKASGNPVTEKFLSLMNLK